MLLHLALALARLERFPAAATRPSVATTHAGHPSLRREHRFIPGMIQEIHEEIHELIQGGIQETQET